MVLPFCKHGLDRPVAYADLYTLLALVRNGRSAIVQQLLADKLRRRRRRISGDEQLPGAIGANRMRCRRDRLHQEPQVAAFAPPERVAHRLPDSERMESDFSHKISDFCLHTLVEVAP